MRKILIIIVLLSLSISLYAKQQEYSLGIYLINKDAAELEDTLISIKPIITDKDIIEYKWETHSIILTDDAFQTITSNNEIDLYGKSFIVVVNGIKCYRGAFWKSISSVSYPNPIINIVPVLPRKKNEIVIERAYPTEKFAKGDDPRSDVRIYNVLNKLKKLKKLPTTQ